MKKYEIRIGNGLCTIYDYYNCGEIDSQLFNGAKKLKTDSGFEKFIEKNFESFDIAHYVLSTDNNEEEGFVSVRVVDEDCQCVFDGKVNTKSNNKISGNPNDWVCDESVCGEIQNRIKNFADCYDDVINKIKNDKCYEEGDLEDEDTYFDYLLDYSDVSGIIFDDTTNDNGEFVNTDDCDVFYNTPYIVCAQSAIVSCTVNIELEDDEEFDPDKLSIFMWDNDAPLNCVEDASVALFSTIKYGNKFYRWEIEFMREKGIYFYKTNKEYLD